MVLMTRVVRGMKMVSVFNSVVIIYSKSKEFRPYDNSLPHPFLANYFLKKVWVVLLNTFKLKHKSFSIVLVKLVLS